MSNAFLCMVLSLTTQTCMYLLTACINDLQPCLRNNLNYRLQRKYSTFVILDFKRRFQKKLKQTKSEHMASDKFIRQTKVIWFCQKDFHRRISKTIAVKVILR